MSTVILVDLSSILHREFAIHQQDGDVNATAHQVVDKVRRLAAGQSRVAICCDSGRSFRKDIAPSYKAQRADRDPSLYHQQALAIEKLKADGFPIWSVKEYEADDLIATATRLALERDGCEVLIVTSDKDMYSLVGPRVQIKRADTGVVLDEDAVVAKFGVRPDQIGDYLALCGDASDNIVGAKGIGAKRAAALLQQFGTLKELYSDFDRASPTEKRLYGFTPAVVDSLTEFAGRLDEVRQLVTLRTDAPIPFDEVFTERVIAPPSPEEDHGFSGSFDEPHEEAMPAAEETTPAVIEGTIEPAASEAPAPKPMPTPTSQALTIAGPQGLVPRNLDEAFRLSKAMHISRQFSAYGNAEAVMATILAGHELGLQPMASLRAVHIIEGKPALSADLIRAKALQHPACMYFRCAERDSTPGQERATFVTKRGDDPEIALTFTVAEARAAWRKGDDAWKKSGWGTWPVDMCIARATVKLARLVYPEVTFGVFEPSELLEGAA
jgi:5'-3' exonuclease